MYSKAMEKTGTVFLVDDDRLVQAMTRTILERRLGHKVITASDGLEAIETFRTHKDDISIVLLDLIMPGLDGWGTMTALRAMRNDIPVILCSGCDEAQVLQGYMRCPEKPQAFLHKPYEMSQLKLAIKSALES